MGIQTTLAKTQMYRGRTYGPGPCTIPDEVAQALGLLLTDDPPDLEATAPKDDGSASTANNESTSSDDDELLDQELQAKIAELQALCDAKPDGWRDIKDLAEDRNLTKPEGQSWREFIPDLAEEMLAEEAFLAESPSEPAPE